MAFGVLTRIRRLRRQIGGADELAAAALTLPIGQISLDEARFLGQLVAGLTGTGPIVEVGTLFGWSTRVMVLFKDPTRKLITVDNYAWNPLMLSPERHRQCTATALAEAVKSHGVEIVFRDKDEFFACYSGPPPALTFLDADHSYEETRKDIAWSKKVNAGLTCVHDYAPEHQGVLRAVDEAGGPKQLVQSLAVL